MGSLWCSARAAAGADAAAPAPPSLPTSTAPPVPPALPAAHIGHWFQVPRDVQALTVQGSVYGILDPGNLPEGLLHLTIHAMLDQVLTDELLPSTLETLELGGGYNRPLGFTRRRLRQIRVPTRYFHIVPDELMPIMDADYHARLPKMRLLELTKEADCRRLPDDVLRTLPPPGELYREKHELKLAIRACPYLYACKCAVEDDLLVLALDFSCCGDDGRIICVGRSGVYFCTYYWQWNTSKRNAVPNVDGTRVGPLTLDALCDEITKRVCS